MAEREYPMVDGAPINPYDMPGEPRPSKDDPSPAPPAEESAPVPGPGDPDVALVELGAGDRPDEVSAASTDNGEDADALSFLTADQRAALAAKGYDSPEAIRAASDDDLDAVDGIGPATVARLRDATRA